MSIAETEFPGLLAFVTEKATGMVQDWGMAMPFAVVVGPDGERKSLMAASRTEDSPRLVELLDGLVLHLRKHTVEKSYRAVALCSTGYVTEAASQQTARSILIAMETVDGAARSLAIPFVRGIAGTYLFHDPLESPGRPVVFTQGDESTQPWRLFHRQSSGEKTPRQPPGGSGASRRSKHRRSR